MGQCRFAHHGGPDFGKVALGSVGQPPVQVITDREFQHRVAEKLQPLVVPVTRVLIAV